MSSAISSIRFARVRAERGACAIFLAVDSPKTSRQISVQTMIRPGNELLTDRHRAAARCLPTTGLIHLEYVKGFKH